MNNKKVMILFVSSFVAPLLFAFVLLKTNWSPSRQVNNGLFLSSQLTLAEWPQINPKQWSILQKTNNSCAQRCLENSKHMLQISNALGKYKNKVDLVTLGSADLISGFKNYPLQNENLQLNTLYLVDRFGIVVLSYSLSNNTQENQQLKQGLIKDLKKLFKFSRSA